MVPRTMNGLSNNKRKKTQDPKIQKKKKKSDPPETPDKLLSLLAQGIPENAHESEASRCRNSEVWRLWSNGTSLDLVDPIILDNCQKSEVVRCIHIGLLCVQEGPVERPTFSSIFVMLTNNIVVLPMPRQPGFFIESRPQNDLLDSDQSTRTKFVPVSVDNKSITDLYPR